jgi:hypothetical protein
LTRSSTGNIARFGTYLFFRGRHKPDSYDSECDDRSSPKRTSFRFSGFRLQRQHALSPGVNCEVKRHRCVWRIPTKLRRFSDPILGPRRYKMRFPLAAALSSVLLFTSITRADPILYGGNGGHPNFDGTPLSIHNGWLVGPGTGLCSRLRFHRASAAVSRVSFDSVQQQIRLCSKILRYALGDLHLSAGIQPCTPSMARPTPGASSPDCIHFPKPHPGFGLSFPCADRL